MLTDLNDKTINVTDLFLEPIEKLAEQPVSEAAYERAKLSLLDYLAVTAAGARKNEERLAKYFEAEEPEDGKYYLIGMDRTTNLKEAVFLNGLNAHTLDFDDGTNAGIIHLGSPVFSVLLPLAQKYDKTVDEVLRAAVIGYETSFTMAMTIQPAHKLMGYHATGTCGVLGIAMAASYLLGLSKEERRNAFAIAAVSASGMLKVLDDGSELKPYNVAKSSLLALTALQLSRAGFRGHSDPLGGRGFIKMMTGRDEIELKKPLIGGTYAIEKTYTKPYASCRYTHPSVEAAIRMYRAGYHADDIERVDIRTYSLAVAGHEHTVIPGTFSAKMSIPYSVAAALICGKAGFTEFDEAHVADGEILSLTKKVNVTADSELSESFPRLQTAIVDFVTKTGTVSERVDFPKGEPENRMTEEEFCERYNDLMDTAGICDKNAAAAYAACLAADAKVTEVLVLCAK